MLGRALADHFAAAGVPVAITTRRPQARPGALRLDLADDPATWRLPDGIQTAFLLAGMTSIDACRDYPDLAATINVRRTATLAEMLVGRGAHVVFASSDRVFDGRSPHIGPREWVSPATVYGDCKAKAERELLAIGGATVLRLSKVIGPATGLTAKWMVNAAAGQPISAFADVKIAPVSLGLASAALAVLGATQPGGIHQLSARDEVSYADFARHLAGGRCDIIETAAGEGKFPRHTTLDTTSLTRVTGIQAPAALDSIDALWAKPRSAAA